MNASDDPIHVLLVDDEPDLAELAATFIERDADAFCVVTATSAREGLDHLVTADFDCIVSDYEMPGRNGIEFLEAVRETHPELPFILFTGKGSEEVASEALSAGVTDYLRKEAGTGQYTVLAHRIRNAVETSRSHQAIEATERKLAQIAEKSDDVLFMFDAEWSELLFVNSRFEEIWGLSTSELRAAPGSFVERIHPEDRPAVRRSMGRLSAGHAEELEYRVVRPDGDRRWVRAESKPLFDDDGTVARIVGFARDVTDRMESERRSRTVTRRLEALHRATRDLLAAETREEVAEIGVSVAETVLDLDANSIHLYDDETATLVPVAVTDAIHGLIGDPPPFEPGDSIAWRVYERGEALALDDVHDDDDLYNPKTPIQSELLVPIATEGILMAGSRTPAAFDQQDRLLGELLAGNIATALEQVERTEQLRARERELTAQNDRLEQFASVVSHDLRNPLTVAQGRLELARETCESPHLDAVERAHDRMETLIADVLALARDGETAMDPTPVDLDGMARACWDLVATAEATLVVDTGATIRADEGRLQQLVENLIRNAVEHVGADVTVTVGTLESGFYVEDDGPGIPPAEREAVLEVGYSTGDDGVGFGLSIVEQTVAAHGWNLRLTGGSDGGLRVEITGVKRLDAESSVS